jgi:hypothetical protein
MGRRRLGRRRRGLGVETQWARRRERKKRRKAKSRQNSQRCLFYPSLFFISLPWRQKHIPRNKKLKNTKTIPIPNTPIPMCKTFNFQFLSTDDKSLLLLISFVHACRIFSPEKPSHEFFFFRCLPRILAEYALRYVELGVMLGFRRRLLLCFRRLVSGEPTMSACVPITMICHEISNSTSFTEGK